MNESNELKPPATPGKAVGRSIVHHPLQPYKSLTEFTILHGVMLPRPHSTWRLLAHPCVGHICGLDRPFSGLAIATNGIMVAILTSAGFVNFGHLEFFIKQQPDAITDLDQRLPKALKPSEVELTFLDLL